MMAGILRAQGYRVLGAIDGESAIKVVEDHAVDLALVDINMAPSGGFEFVKYLVIKGLDIPVVIITGDDSTHVLMESNALGVRRVLQKPVEPDRLIQTVQRLLKRKGINPAPLAVTAHDTIFIPEALMARAIDLADKNAAAKKGGPFGAIVTDKDGRILGEGTSGLTSRVDPVAHAEVMAIRKASEKLGSADLSNCVLYCSSEPTMMGKALIASVGIKKVYYGLSHKDTGANENPAAPDYIQMAQADALKMFRHWKN
jgi:tRNA(Arg) A34 adenosine deaminase TadA/CheY-like chemotaxis protein